MRLPSLSHAARSGHSLREMRLLLQAKELKARIVKIHAEIRKYEKGKYG